jgi:hypothetical protein
VYHSLQSKTQSADQKIFNDKLYDWLAPVKRLEANRGLVTAILREQVLRETGISAAQQTSKDGCRRPKDKRKAKIVYRII